MSGFDYLHILRPLLPECAVLLTALVVLLFDLRWGRGRTFQKRAAGAAGLTTVGLLGAIAIMAWGEKSAGLPGGMLVLSLTGQAVKIVVLLLAAAAAWLTTEEEFTNHVGEFFALLLFATLGMLFLISTENLLMVFVSLELLSLSLYTMVAFSKRSSRSAEAALKYFLFGGMAAAFTLFGFSLLYGLTGAIDFSGIAARLPAVSGDPLLWVALVMVLAGFGFKIAAAPFHLWAPDAYEGAPAAAAAFIASGSKVASFYILARLLHHGFAGAEGSGAWHAMAPGWAAIVSVLAAASMILGNFAALAQSGVRRLLAYSAVAHAGYALLGVLGEPQRAAPALMYYVITYALTVLGAFGVVAVVAERTGSGAIGSLAGLRTRSPLLAWTLTVFVLSLAGIPPLAGFFGKFYVFVNATRAGGNLGYFWLVLVALATSCVSLYYYLQLLKQVWVAEPAGREDAAGNAAVLVPPGFATRTILLALAAGVILLGCFPQWLLAGLQ